MPYQQKIKLVLAYDGSRYSGWQVQPNAVTIQEILQTTLKTLLQHDVEAIASGRTDAGVHAKQQVVHFIAEKEVDLHRLQRSLNGLLPKDIRVLSAEQVDRDFHARYSACGKIYHYHLHLDPVRDPFVHPYRWHTPYSLDLDLMHEAASYLIGTHDFTTFANEAAKGAAAKSAVRTIYRIDLVPQEGGIRLEFEGSGFLYKMIRNIAGTLVEVAGGKRPVGDIPKILMAKDRRLAGRAAPAHGLFLMEVQYPLKKGCN